MRTQGAARLPPPHHPGEKTPLSVTLSKVRDFQSASMWQVRQSNREPNQLGSHLVKLDVQTITGLKREKDRMFVKMRFSIVFGARARASSPPGRAWVMRGPSHPSGVWYLIAWIDRPKESVTFSSHCRAASSPNKAAERRRLSPLLRKVN